MTRQEEVVGGQPSQAARHHHPFSFTITDTPPSSIPLTHPRDSAKPESNDDSSPCHGSPSPPFSPHHIPSLHLLQLVSSSLPSPHLLDNPISPPATSSRHRHPTHGNQRRAPLCPHPSSS